MELINEAIFQDFLHTTFKDKGESSVQGPGVALSAYEENIIRYPCRYIGMKLRPNYKQGTGLVESLDRLQVDIRHQTSSF